MPRLCAAGGPSTPSGICPVQLAQYGELLPPIDAQPTGNLAAQHTGPAGGIATAELTRGTPQATHRVTPELH